MNIIRTTEPKKIILSLASDNFKTMIVIPEAEFKKFKPWQEWLVLKLYCNVSRFKPALN